MALSHGRLQLNPSTKRRLVRAGISALLLLALPADAGTQTPAGAAIPCHSGLGMGGAGPVTRGMGDQRFIVMMIPHHDGAIAMADLALSRARHPELKALAQRIKTSQTRENDQMRRWYRQWFGSDLASSWPVAAIGMPWGMGHGAMGRHGMGISLEALKRAPDFDRAFIEQMIPHHRMGVMMASMAQVNSQHPELRDLQAAMVRVQSEEIQQMEQWYRQWNSTAASR